MAVINELQEQWASTCDQQALATQLDQLERECQLRLRRQSTLQQFRSLNLQANALSAAIKILETIEVK